MKKSVKEVLGILGAFILIIFTIFTAAKIWGVMEEDYVKLQWISKWDGKLPQYILGSSTSLYMPVNQ